MGRLQNLSRTGVVILDGGLGTTLEDLHSLPISDTPLWSGKAILDHPESIIQVHLSFLRAGARIILTSTYQCAFLSFEKAGYSQRDAKEIMLKSVKLAKEAKQRFVRERSDISEEQICVALSLGSFGSMLSPCQEFNGLYPPPYGPKGYSALGDNCNAFAASEVEAMQGSIDALASFYLERLRVFAIDPETWDAIDCIAFETIPVMREIQAVRLAMRQLYDEKKAQSGEQLGSKEWWISLVFPDGQFPETDGPGGQRLPVSRVVEAALTGDNKQYLIPTGIGINCTLLRIVRDIVAEMTKAVLEIQDRETERPWLVLYPNGGEIYDNLSRKWVAPDGESKGREDKTWAEELSGIVRSARKEEVWEGVVVGGCCKAGPDSIQVLANSLTA